MQSPRLFSNTAPEVVVLWFICGKKIPRFARPFLPHEFLGTTKVGIYFIFPNKKRKIFTFFFVPIYKRGRARSIRAGGLGGGSPSRAEHLTRRHPSQDLRGCAAPRTCGRLCKGVTMCNNVQTFGHVQGCRHVQRCAGLRICARVRTCATMCRPPDVCKGAGMCNDVQDPFVFAKCYGCGDLPRFVLTICGNSCHNICGDALGRAADQPQRTGRCQVKFDN